MKFHVNKYCFNIAKLHYFLQGLQDKIFNTLSNTSIHNLSLSRWTDKDVNESLSS